LANDFFLRQAPELRMLSPTNQYRYLTNRSLMANWVIVRSYPSGGIVWTDEKPGDDSFTRRNVLTIGRHCVALHDDLDSWLPAATKVISDRAYASLPLEQVVERLGQAFQALSLRPTGELGAIVLGFLESGAPAIAGLHSSRDFAPRRSTHLLYGGPLPESVVAYMRQIWTTLPQTYDDVVDQTLLLGDVCYDTVLYRAGAPRAAAVSRLEWGRPLTWLDRGDISSRALRNERRLQALRRSMLKHFSESTT
jgi:hypothetical protein